MQCFLPYGGSTTIGQVHAPIKLGLDKARILPIVLANRGGVGEDSPLFNEGVFALCPKKCLYT